MSKSITRPDLILCVMTWLAVFVFTGSALAQGQPAVPSDAQLDALLTARDWNRLGAALNSSRAPEWGLHRMNWFQSRLDAGGGSFLGFMYIRDLWGYGNAAKNDDPAKDTRLTAGMIWLYTYELIAIDGAKCEDRTAPAHRVEQLSTTEPNRSVLAYLKAKPPDLKDQVIGVAIAFERKTAPLRKEDDLICRDGLEQMQAGIAAGTTHDVPTPAGGYGKTVAVEAPPGYAPKYLPIDKYAPARDQARANMKTILSKILQ